MKKYLALFLTMAMSFGVLAGCGGGNEEPAATDGADTAERTTFTEALTQNIPLTASKTTLANMLASTWIWLRKYVTATAGN